MARTRQTARKATGAPAQPRRESAILTAIASASASEVVKKPETGSGGSPAVLKTVVKTKTKAPPKTKAAKKAKAPTPEPEEEESSSPSPPPADD